LAKTEFLPDEERE